MAAPTGEKFEDIVSAIVEKIGDAAVRSEAETFMKNIQVQRDARKDEAER